VTEPQAIKKAARVARKVCVALGGTLLFLVLFEISLRVAFWSKDRLANRTDTVQDRRAKAEVYTDAARASSLFREFHDSYRARWEPYVYWRRAAFTGDFININGRGIRYTTGCPVSEPTNTCLEVFVLGGSTAWGTGVQDSDTIPSVIQRRLTAAGIRARVTNYAETGYVSTQEVIALLCLLRASERPDAVVFLNGVNDTFSALQQGAAGLPQNELHRRREFNILKAERYRDLRQTFAGAWVGRLAVNRLAVAIGRRVFGERSIPRNGHEDALSPASTLPRDVIQQYDANMDLINAVAKANGFRADSYWQPTLFTKQVRTKHEQSELELRLWARPFFEAVNLELRNSHTATRSNFHDLSDVFDTETRSVYIDFCHLGKFGSETIGSRIAEDLIAHFTRL